MTKNLPNQREFASTVRFFVLSLLLIAAAVLAVSPANAQREIAEDLNWTKQRGELVRQLQRDGISSLPVIEAMQATPRHEFVPKPVRKLAYLDRPLPIGKQQTISQPYIVAYMTEALQLKPSDTVLEIGTGSGYQAAVLAQLAKQVYTIEIIPALGNTADAALKRLGYRNVSVRIGDGYLGWPEKAPFDAIILTAAPPRTVPAPLLQQLAEGGRLIAPVGKFFQELVLIKKNNGQLNRKKLLPVRFVPMTGEAQSK